MEKKTTRLEPIQSDQRFAAAEAILRALADGLAMIERERDWLQAEEHLRLLPNDKRALAARNRLAKQRAGAQQTKTEPAPSADLAPAVAAFLELLRDGRRRPAPRGRRTLIEQLEGDHDLGRQAILEQQLVVDGLRADLSGELALRLKKPHRELVLEQYRAMQVLAATTDAEREFRKCVIDGGYTWRADVLPAPTLRSALVLGSETDWDSEVSRVRRLLEELKVI